MSSYSVYLPQRQATRSLLQLTCGGIPVDENSIEIVEIHRANPTGWHCPIDGCTAVLSRKSSVKTHVYRHLPRSTRKRVAICVRKGFIKRGDLNRHLRCVHSVDVMGCPSSVIATEI
ncbi:hypothetical protein BC829DRAFT_410642, partial [Chytridium lagenaria]